MAPERIVSLVPSLTETLFALGVGESIVGRTRYCIDVRRVFEMEPDLIVAAKEDRIRLVDGKLSTWYGPRIASNLTQICALWRS